MVDIELSKILFDIDKLKNDIRYIIATSQELNLSKVKADDLVERWLIAKAPYINAFNGNMSYTTPDKVAFELSQEEQNKRFTNFLSGIDEVNNEVATFINDMGVDCFYANITDKDYDGYGVHIDKGTKL